MADRNNADVCFRLYMKSVTKFSLYSEEEQKLKADKYSLTREKFEKIKEELSAVLMTQEPYVNIENKKEAFVAASEYAENQALKCRDLGLRSELINRNLRLVVKIANRKAATPALARFKMDLINEGNVGLMKGVDRFDSSKNIPLVNWVAMWIRAYIGRFIMTNSRLVKSFTTESHKNLFYNLNAEKAKMLATGNGIDYDVLAKHFNVSVDDICDMEARLEASDLSLSTPFGSDDSGEELGDHLADPNPNSQEGSTEQFLAQKMMAKFRETIPHRMTRDKKVCLALEIFDCRFMKWGSPQEMETFESIGNRCGLSKQRVEQVSVELWQRMTNFMFRELAAQND